jgi:hypothetical protein
MLGVLGFYAASKGSSVVPLLTGLGSSQAQSAITAVGLTVGSVTTTSSGATSENNNTVATQSISAGTVVDQETTVDIVTYAYVPVPPTFGPDFTPTPTTTWYCRYMENTGETFTYTATSNESYCTNGVAGVACSTSGYPAPSSGIYTCPPAPPTFTPPTFAPAPPTFTPPTFTPAPATCLGQPEPYPGECFCTGSGWLC